MIKPRLLLLSDLFGGNPEWIKYYSRILDSKFDIHYYDVLKLAKMDSLKDEANIHKHFLNGGIDQAIASLLNNEKEEVVVLGFSIGGTIAWKAALKGLKVAQLVAVSSTRLRFETETPDCKVELYFGEKDLNKPNPQWFSDQKISAQIFDNQEHQLYQENQNTLLICSSFL
ncbi:alpha/beta hydrolase family protein [Flavobacterium branchiicola]|uniref:Alpha/beta hydrolase n=1 Tax=Flavobacterium branchiicola TaxID=1114875 RepID=A0ABV9PAM1_9FLAO|nr:alpha/beta hydrolase [Flavobacterium branchiicola]MBS7252840.1 alpha/beta hydrolase [Flavobacterium branchiicola]